MNTSHAIRVFSSMFLLLAMVLLMFLLLMGPVLVWAAPTASIIRVTVTGTTTWPCGSTWGSPCTLQTALSNTVSGDEIWVAQGIYTPTMGITRSATFQMVAGVSIYGGFAMTETARDQRNWTTHVVTLSGDLLGNDGPSFTNCDDNSYHVVIGANNATLDGVTVAHGYASTVGSTLGMGGGMYNQNITGLTISNAIFRDNYAENSGGGIESFFGSATISNVLILNNASKNGGGIDAPYAMLNLVKVSFIGNAATDWGGGLKVDGNVNVNLSNVTFSGNSAPMGGGIDTSDDSYGVTTLNHVTFSGNSGRAISNAARHYFRIYHSVLWGDSGGSEIYSNFMAGIVISNSVVQGGYYGGGTNMILTNPRLGTLGYYGGATPVLPLLPDSAAINGDSTTCPATDQRGVTRGTVCDLGSYEARPFNVTGVGGSGQATPINLTFGQPLTMNLASPYGDPVDGGVITFVGPLTGAGTNPITHTGTISGGAVSRSLTANAVLGVYTVTADATGITGGPFAFTLTNLKGNTALTVTAVPNPAIVGQTVMLTTVVASLSGTPTGTVQLYVDGTARALTLSSGRTVTSVADLLSGTHIVTATYLDNGIYNSCTGVLSGGLTITDVLLAGLTVSNSSPAYATVPTFFTATVSAGHPLTYQWNFGDGQTAFGASTSHLYVAPGTYDVVVTATGTVNVLTQTTSILVQRLAVSNLALSAHPATLLANGVATSLVTITATDQLGHGASLAGVTGTLDWALGNDPVPLTVTLGASGTAQALYTAGVVTGTDRITATFVGNGITHTAGVDLQLQDAPLQGNLTTLFRGNLITYTFVVTNMDAAWPQTNLVISGSVPAYTVLVWASTPVTSTTGGDYGQGYVQLAPVSSLAPGGTVQLVWSVRTVTLLGDIVTRAHGRSDTAVLRLLILNRIYRMLLPTVYKNSLMP